ncbi:MAG: DUF6034 family protein [Christensenellaceae bacterium]|jgi:hypothetical protein
MQKKKNLLYLCLVLLLFFSACQKTPEQSFVENKSKSADTLKDIITEESEINNDFSDVPALYEKEMENENTKQKVYINATIEMPEIDKYPVAQFSPVKFTQEEIDTMVYGIMGDDLYAPREIEKDYSKDEIMQIILDLKSGKNSGLYEIDPEAYADEIKGEIEYYENIYKVAPIKPVVREGDTKPKPDPENKDILLMSVTAKLGKTKEAFFSYTDNSGKMLEISFHNINERSVIGGKEVKDIEIQGKGVTISLEQAKGVAESTLKEMGFGEFSFAYAGSMPGEEVVDYSNIKSYEKLDKCYVLYYTRTVNGLVENHTNFAYTEVKMQGQGIYNYIWRPEFIQFAIDDTGVSSLYYWGPKAKVEVLTENVQLKPFAEIQEIFEKQVLIEDYNLYQESGIISTEIYVDKIKLGGMRIINKDGKGEYLFVPVWDFYGHVKYEYAPGMGDVAQLDYENKWIEDGLAFSLLTINAIDGTVINRAQGY